MVSEEFLLNKSQYDASSWTIRSKIWDFVQIFPGGWAMSEAICKLPEKQCARMRVRPEQSLNQSNISMSQDSVKSKSKVAQSCLTLCNPVDCSLQGSSVHGIFQARVLEWVATSFSRGSSWPSARTQVSSIADALPSEPPGKPTLGFRLQQMTFGKIQVSRP